MSVGEPSIHRKTPGFLQEGETRNTAPLHVRAGSGVMAADVRQEWIIDEFNNQNCEILQNLPDLA